MNNDYLGLALLPLLVTACFSPDGEDPPLETVGSTGDTETPEPTGTSTPLPVDPSGDTTGGEVPLPTDTESGEVGGSSGESGGSTGIGDDTDGGTDTGSTGDEETGAESSSETGTQIECVLGTDLDCLECGDACIDEATCHPEGCLASNALGHPDPFDNLGGLDGFLWGFPIDVTSASRLTHLGFIANGQGGSVQLSLYSDAAGTPFARLVTADAVVGYTSGTHELEVDETELEPGVYWLMATATNPTRLAVDLNNGQVNFPVQGIIHDFADGHPNVVVEPIGFVNFRPNFYMRVLQPQLEQ